jgi:uncharacterized membrane-anchored protein
VKRLPLILFVIVALLQISVPASAIWNRHQTFKQGRIWKLRTVPVDPVDAFRGRYIALRFEAEQFTQEKDFSYGTVYVTLKENSEGFAEVDHVTDKPESGDNVVSAHAGYAAGPKRRIYFPFDHYWVAEKDAAAADAAYAKNTTRDKHNAYVTVRVRSGDAAIEELYIEGQPLKEYLRVHREK